MYQIIATNATMTSESSLIGLDNLGYPQEWAGRAAAITKMTESIAPHLLDSARGLLNASGLTGNMVYELPKLSDTVVTATVSAYITNVTCGYIAFQDQTKIFNPGYYWPEMQSGRESFTSPLA
jgi:hypothetical protein